MSKSNNIITNEDNNTQNDVETKKKSVKTSEKKKEYMKEYRLKNKNELRKKDNERIRRYTNNKNLKEKYDIPENIIEKYNIYLYDIITVYRKKKNIPSEYWNMLLNEIDSFDFDV